MNSISLSVAKLARMIETIFEDEISDTELSRGQYAYILYLYDHAGTNQYDISQNLLIDKTTVAKALKKLEKNKYIFRRTDPRDKRRVKVYLSSKGKEAYEQVSAVFDKIEKQLSTQIRSSNEQEFYRLVNLYIQELDLKWSDIKNYRKKEVFEIASHADMEQIAIRRGAKFREHEQIFVKKLGDYVYNWLQFRTEEPYTIIEDVHVHKETKSKTDEQEILNAFIMWHDSKVSNQLLIASSENAVEFQQFILKNGFYFARSSSVKGENIYYYDRLDIRL